MRASSGANFFAFCLPSLDAPVGDAAIEVLPELLFEFRLLADELEDAGVGLQVAHHARCRSRRRRHERAPACAKASTHWANGDRCFAPSPAGSKHRHQGRHDAAPRPPGFSRGLVGFDHSRGVPSLVRFDDAGLAPMRLFCGFAAVAVAGAVVAIGPCAVGASATGAGSRLVRCYARSARAPRRRGGGRDARRGQEQPPPAPSRASPRRGRGSAAHRR